jgi:hypothetical protein
MINETETIRTVRNESLLLKLSLCVAFSFLLFYANLWNILRLSGGTPSRVVGFASVILLLGCFGLYFLVELVWFRDLELSLPPSLMFGIVGFYLAISTSYGFGRVWLTTEYRTQQLALEKKQSELTLLRNQLQPHFLFNALNNLLSLVDQEKSPLLATSIDRLSGLLRHVVYDTATGLVTVRQEIEFIRNYAELQLLRFDQGELDFQLNISGTYDEQEIEPGIFIPFIENAFKYGAEPEKQSVIALSVDITAPDKVTFRVENTVFPALQNDPGSQKGIATTKKRLKLSYPGRHQLKIEGGQIFRVVLTLVTQ